MDFKIADMLIDSYAKAAERTRKVFITLNVISIIFFIAFFNYKYSWLRNKQKIYLEELNIIRAIEGDSLMMTQQRFIDSLTVLKLDVDSRKKLLVDKNQVDNKFVTFDLIGAKIYVEDLPVLGSIALAIILTWFFYCNRRETGIIKEISRRVKIENDVSRVDYLYFGTSFNLIFNTIKNVDEELTFGQLFSVYIRRGLLFLPTAILFWVSITDAYETFFGKNTWYRLTDFGTRFEMVVRTIIPIILLIYCYLLTKSVLNFSRKDAEYRDEMLKKYLSFHERPENKKS